MHSKLERFAIDNVIEVAIDSMSSLLAFTSRSQQAGKEVQVADPSYT